MLTPECLTNKGIQSTLPLNLFLSTAGKFVESLSESENETTKATNLLWQASLLFKVFFLFFFYKDQRRKDGTDFETNMVSSFQSAPVLHWRAKPYSALSFDRVNVFSMAHLFSLSRKPFVMCYCFREPIKLSFLTPVKWLSNRVSCSFFPVPQTGSHIINILLASFSSSVPSP